MKKYRTLKYVGVYETVLPKCFLELELSGSIGNKTGIVLQDIKHLAVLLLTWATFLIVSTTLWNFAQCIENDVMSWKYFVRIICVLFINRVL